MAMRNIQVLLLLMEDLGKLTAQLFALMNGERLEVLLLMEGLPPMKRLCCCAIDSVGFVSNENPKTPTPMSASASTMCIDFPLHAFMSLPLVQV